MTATPAKNIKQQVNWIGRIPWSWLLYWRGIQHFKK